VLLGSADRSRSSSRSGWRRRSSASVVPWNEDEIDTWRRARRAVDLLGRQPIAPAPSIADPVVEAAMTSLTHMVNLSTGLHHPDDRSSAIQAFRILERNRHRIDPAEIRAWAMVNGWSAEHARASGISCSSRSCPGPGRSALNLYPATSRSWRSSMPSTQIQRTSQPDRGKAPPRIGTELPCPQGGSHSILGADWERRSAARLGQAR
jgi:hypothetical protein